ncbi:hypothetical protein AALO_G00059950 [Alosa alosa]|uniref:YTH domain-containing family protein n=1 Tax=Alosa alosa TaxID=278164 RepID=A0AAV6H854_9TELE|nr:hypothetical protein AALO_G00059950 [Alosa alosa]
MSATSIDPQRPKGQASKVQNGSLHQKDTVHDNDFEPYLPGQSTQSNSYQSMSDPYLSSYYAPSIGFPYPLSEAPWSTGGDPPIPYLTPYGPLSNGDHHFMHDTLPPELPQPHGEHPGAGSLEASMNSLEQGMNSLEQGMVGLKIGAGDGPGSGVKAVGSVIGGGPSIATGNGTPIGMALSKPTSWAAIASKPAKPPQLKLKSKGGVVTLGAALPPPPIKHNMDIGTWDNKGPVSKVASPPHELQHQHQHQHPHPHSHLHPHQHPEQQSSQPLPNSQPLPLPPPPLQPPQSLAMPASPSGPNQPPLQAAPQHYQNHSQPPLAQTRWVAPRNRNPGYGQSCGGGPGMLDGGSLPLGVTRVTVAGVLGVAGAFGGAAGDPHPVLEKLRSTHSYNPKDFDWNLRGGRVFIIKSYSEDDIHRSIKYSIWCSTEHGNKRLDAAFRSATGKGPVYLLYSVNGSGHFCGVAEMRSPVDYSTSAGVWAQDKWKGKFDVDWLFIKDVPNSQLRHIRLENNDNKPVTNSRDTQEVPLEKAKQVLKIIATYKHTTSIFDDFSHYEKRQEEEEEVRKNFQPEPAPIQNRSRLDQERQNRNKQ